MYEYHLFIINNNAYKLYKKHPDVLYKILFTLYNMKKENFDYGIKLYNDICKIVSVKLLTNYFFDRFDIEKNNKYLYLKKSKDLIKISPSNILVITDIKKPLIFKIFNIYNKKILAIDFRNNNYFWLNDL